MGTDDYSTKPMIVGKGVLQGDCYYCYCYISPLLFSVIVNTHIKSIDHKKIRCMGYSSAKTLLPRQWFRLSQHQLKKITNWN